MDDLRTIAAQLRECGDQLQKYADRCVKPAHLARHISDAWVTAGRLMISAIDLKAFPKERREVNRGWWDRTVGRFPGGPVALYGSIPQALLKSATLKPKHGHGEIVAVNEPDPQAVEQYRIDATKPFEPEQFAKSWLFAFGSWIVKKFPERFRHNAASWDWTHIRQDELGRPLDKHGRPVKGHWYPNGELLPSNFQWHPSMPDGKYEWKLDSKVGDSTDSYSESDWLEHHRITAAQG